MLSSALASAVLAFALWGFASNIPTVFAFAVIFGGIVRALRGASAADLIVCAQSGGFSSSWPAAATDIAGAQSRQLSFELSKAERCAGKQPQQAGLVFAFLALMKAVAAIAGPTIAGTLYVRCWRPLLSNVDTEPLRAGSDGHQECLRRLRLREDDHLRASAPHYWPCSPLIVPRWARQCSRRALAASQHKPLARSGNDGGLHRPGSLTVHICWNAGYIEPVDPVKRWS
jgi:hypothetical protein